MLHLKLVLLLTEIFQYWLCLRNTSFVPPRYQKSHGTSHYTTLWNIALKNCHFQTSSLKNKNGQIITDIYCKPTDTQQYLHFNSHHPKNCIKSTPYPLACRICTIITNKNLRKTHLKELHTTHHQRGYPTTQINKRLRLAEKIPLKELWTPKKHNKNPLHTLQPTTKRTQNLGELKNNEKMKEILNTTKVIESQRQPKNL